MPPSVTVPSGSESVQPNDRASSSSRKSKGSSKGSRSSRHDVVQEMALLSIAAENALQARLDSATKVAKDRHEEQLKAAWEAHERVREAAEIARAKHDILVRHERARAEQKAIQLMVEEQERLNAIEAENDRRKIEALKLQQARDQRAADEITAANKARESAHRRLMEARDAAAQAEATRQTEINARDQAERERKAKEQARKVELSKLPDTPCTPMARPGAVDPVHFEYVEIHQRLKRMRAMVVEAGKQNQEFRKAIGEERRNIRKYVGQITTETAKNKPVIQKISDILTKAKAFRQCEMVNIKDFLASEPSGPRAMEPMDQDAQHSIVFVYLLNIFTKSIISQFVNEVGVAPKQANSFGVVAVSIFGRDDMRWCGHSLIDVLLAKFHVLCPVLFGLYGDDRSVKGKEKIGWWREEPKGPFVSEERHCERMTGLAAGFAACTLRNFGKSKMVNPIANSHYWSALACVNNTPPTAAGITQFVVIKAMIQNYEKRFFEAYGYAALPSLRRAVVEFPAEVEATGFKSATIGGVKVLKDVLEREYGVRIDPADAIMKMD